MTIILVIIGIFAVLLPSTYAYLGGFQSIGIKVARQEKEIMVYEKVRGNYRQTPEVTDRIYFSLLNEEKITTTRGVEIFYDNPRYMEKEERRSEVSCLLDKPDHNLVAKLAEKYQVKTLNDSDYLVAEFPYKGILSVLLGITTVYPALEKYSKVHGYQAAPIIEIYDVPDKKILYRK